MSHHRILTGGASICAISLALASAALAQTSLPSIDVGAARRSTSHAARHVSAPAPTHRVVAAPKPRPQPVVAARPAAPPPSVVAADKLGHTDKPFSGSHVPESVSHVATTASATKQEIDQTVNVMTTAETFKYLPSVLVRERFIGDRNATVEGRVNNPQDSARTMVYADGVLLSNYLGNSFAYPPRWNMVSPVEIDRVDVIYGPTSALYGGNSVSGVYTVTTRMPEHFELHAEGNASLQPFSWFQRTETDLSGHMSLAVGDRYDKFSYWLIYDRLDAQGQSQTFSGPNNFLTSVPAKGYGSFPVFGGLFVADQAGVLSTIDGSAGQDHAQSHFGKVKLAYDFAPGVRLAYQAGFWSLNDNTFVQPFMQTTTGVPIYSLGKNNLVNLGPYGDYPVAALNPTHSNASHLMQTVELRSDTKGIFDYDLVATQYNFLRDYTNTAAQYGFIPNSAPTKSSSPSIFTLSPTSYTINPQGSNVNQGGNFWRTFDGRTIFRPENEFFGKHIISTGVNDWLYSLNSVQTNTNVWMSNYYNSIQAINYGKTDTLGLYVQDEWKFLPQWQFTYGARGDYWKAYGGQNNTLGKPLLSSPISHKNAFEPKGALEYQVTPEFVVRGSIARNYRFPTAAELFQAIAGPNSVLVNNPDLQPEISTYYDLTGEYRWKNAFWGNVGMAVPRVSLFQDDRWNFIASQTALTTGVLTTQQYNIPKVRFQGVEGAISFTDIVWHGLNATGSMTFTNSKTLSDYQAPWFQGMQVPRIPRIRLRGTVSYSPEDTWSVAAGMRYASGSFVSLANTDFNHNSYGTTDSEYLVFDAKVQYKFAKNWTASAGIDNIGRWKYFVNPNPYPERTFFLGVKYDIGGPEHRETAAGLVVPGDASGVGTGSSPNFR